MILEVGFYGGLDEAMSVGIHDETCGPKRDQHLLFLPCEDTVRRQPSAEQKDSYHHVFITVLLPPKVTYERRSLF